MIDMWCRQVMNTEVMNRVKSMPYKKLRVLEISGTEWKKFGFKSYKSLAYPQFDICKETIDEQFDLIIAEQVFEHIEDPDTAAENILKMLRDGGTFLITVPFLIKYHPAPLDMYRWTKPALKYFLEKKGYNHVETFSWGNKECLIGNLEDWPKYDVERHSLVNDEDYPIMVWGFACKPKRTSMLSKLKK
jgi:SAM-dependent methyltransferase